MSGEVTTANVEGCPDLKRCAAFWPHEEILEGRTKVRGQDARSNTASIPHCAQGSVHARAGVVRAQAHTDTATPSPGAELQGSCRNPDRDERPPSSLASPVCRCGACPAGDVMQRCEPGNGCPLGPWPPTPRAPAGEVSWAGGREHRAEAEPCAHRPLRTRRSTHAHVTVPCGTAASCRTQALPLQPHQRRPRATERTARGSWGPWEAARWRAEAAGWGWAGWCPGPHALPHVPSPRCPAVGGRVALLWTTEVWQTLGLALTRGLLPGRQWDRDLILSDFSGRTATKSCWNRGRTPVPPRCAAPRGPTGEPLVHPTGFPVL